MAIFKTLILLSTPTPPISTISLHHPISTLSSNPHSLFSTLPSLLSHPPFLRQMPRNPNPNHSNHFLDRSKLIICSAASDASLSGFPEEFWPLDPPASEPLLSQPVVPNKRSKEKKAKLIAGVDQSELVDPWLLADPDSRFADFFGVQVHYKIARPSPEGDQMEAFAAAEANVSSRLSGQVNQVAESSLQTMIGIPAICLHGFGASIFSWERVLQPLAKCLGSEVVAFDRPAFGLTSRPHPQNNSSQGHEKLLLNPYSLEFSAKLSLAFIDFLKADKAILVGKLLILLPNLFQEANLETSEAY